jgi:mannosyltransferase OCH1-like enzyme
MIPKIIHYCWFGEKGLPDLAKKCLSTWMKYFPDYQIMLWNEENSPMQLPYMQKALSHKKWANLSNLTRLHALKEFGGIYFDTDIEVIKPFEFLKDTEATCVLGLETKGYSKRYLVNNAVMIAEVGDAFTTACYEELLRNFNGTEVANLSSPVLVTELLKSQGFRGNAGMYGTTMVMPYDYFYPTSWNEIFDYSVLTENTCCIHHYDASWVSVKDLTDESYKQLLKDRDFYKIKYEKLNSGHESIGEMLKLNFRFLKNLF